MTKLLARAIKAVSQRPEKHQDAIASLILTETASKRWKARFKAQKKPKPVFGGAKGQIFLSPDFDEPMKLE